MSPILRFFSVAALLLVSWLLTGPACLAQDKEPVVAQTEGTTLQVGGLAFLDYSYIVASPSADEEGAHGFGYRRLYLTTDFNISEAFSGRARLEANDGSTTAQGRPAPFVKDLYLRWHLGSHDLTFGLSAPPSFTVAEDVWGYRSLEATIMNRNDILASRDLGVKATGKLRPDGSLRYGLMVANNNGVRGEDDKYKRVYGQLEFYPNDHLHITVGSDYADYNDERDNILNFNAFAGYVAERFRVGAEGFWSQANLNDEGSAVEEDTEAQRGISLFAVVSLHEQWEAVGRFDQVARDFRGVESSERFFVAGAAYVPHAQVRFIPNVLLSKESIHDDAHLTGRLTLALTF